MLDRVNALEAQFAGLQRLLSRFCKAHGMDRTQAHISLCPRVALEAKHPAAIEPMSAVRDLQPQTAAVSVHTPRGISDRTRWQPVNSAHSFASTLTPTLKRDTPTHSGRQQKTVALPEDLEK